MFLHLFTELRGAKVPVTLREHLQLLEAMDRGVIDASVDDFYVLARAALVKDERHLDRFDRVFAQVFKGFERVDEALAANIPEDWLRRLAERLFTEEEKAQVQALGGLDKLMETLKERLAEQHARHQGGSKWIGTGGTSPFGYGGYNPEGVRIGGGPERGQGRAVKVWERREYRNLDDTVELGTRNIKVALRRLRRFARTGALDELDLDGTITGTAQKGYLDVVMRPERRNAIKVLLFFDVGGSMDGYIKLCEELFSAARAEFKHLEFFYFHNCLYEKVWKDNRRRHAETLSTTEVLNTYGRDYKAIFVGDATMGPYEITYPGGSVEHWNEEAGATWMGRVAEAYPHLAWLNPVPERYWSHTASAQVMRQLVGGRMFPLTLEGLDRAMRELLR
ncbi:MAG: VWA domain-containing protein [Caulobacteraceae bacterium]|nr:VWA domain-containing protein [Caulobacter sp.]